MAEHTISQRHSLALELPLRNHDEFVALIEQGGFRVAPVVDEPWGADIVSFQAFILGSQDAMSITGATVLIVDQGNDRAFVTLMPYRRLLWWFCLPRDLRLVRRLADWLIENGATDQGSDIGTAG